MMIKIIITITIITINIRMMNATLNITHNISVTFHMTTHVTMTTHVIKIHARYVDNACNKSSNDNNA